MAHALPTIQTNFQYLYGAPKSKGVLKSIPEDFIVKEDLGFELTGEGEHIFIEVQKTGANTMFVAEVISKYLKIHPKFITHAGLKDRHGVTQQWFGIHLPGKETPDLLALQHPEFKVLQQTRHNKKLKIGALAGNFFELIVREIDEASDLEARLQHIKIKSVPNYFGEQRFGHEYSNLLKVMAWSKGLARIPDRSRKSFFLSAARSYLFNKIVSARIENKTYDQPLVGDQMQFSDGNSYFRATSDQLEDIRARFEKGLLRITAPMIGKGAWKDADDLESNQVTLFEQSIAKVYPELLSLLEKETDAQRRAISLFPQDLTWQWLDAQTLQLQFYLPAGSYATSVMREIICSGSSLTE